MSVIDILSAAKKAEQEKQLNGRIYLENGLLSIANGVFDVWIYQNGLSKELMCEPIELRDEIMNIEIELDPEKILLNPWNWDEKTIEWANKKIEKAKLLNNTVQD